MKFFRCSRLLCYLGGIATLVVLSYYSDGYATIYKLSYSGRVYQLEAASDKPSFTQEFIKPSASEGSTSSTIHHGSILQHVSKGKSFRRGESMTFNSLALENLYISVKTTPKYYESRIHVLKMTWFQLVKKDKLSIVSDFINNSQYGARSFETELTKEGFQLVLANCSVAHERDTLCCKSGTEYKQFYAYLESNRKDKHQLKWFCHFDDDVYVNIKELLKLLAKYNSSKPYYIGRNPRGPNGKVLNRSAFKRVQEHYQAKENVYLYSAGAAYCISLTLMDQLKDYFNGVKRFTRMCEITGITDDLTIGVIIDMVLGYKLVNIETMYTQSVNLRHLEMKNLTELISFGYQTDTNNRIHYIIDPKPILKGLHNQDPTRFLTYHCLVYNETSWCPVGK